MKDNTRHNLQDFGILVLRIGIGIMFVLHGYPKLFGGVATWTSVGGAMSTMGITSAPAFWGFMAALSETLGGLFLIFGFLSRIASLFLCGTMFVAFMMHFKNGDSFVQYSHALEAAILFFSLIIIGPGKIAVDRYLFKK